MGPDRIQGALDKRGLIHEHPAQQYGGIYRHEEYGKFGTGVDTVSLHNLGRNLRAQVRRRITQYNRDSGQLRIETRWEFEVGALLTVLLSCRCNNVLWISSAKGAGHDDAKMED